MTKYVYGFGDGEAEGSVAMSALLGGKGANLAEMSRLGLPVPPGFTITTEVCGHFEANGHSYPEELQDQVSTALTSIGARFGDADDPLLVSVRSGAPASMPGMMETVLNLGLNDSTVEGLARQSGDGRFAYDSYRRFIQMYGDVVLGAEHFEFEDLLEHHKERRGLTLDTELSEEDWRVVVAGFLTKIEEETGEPFPQDPHAQLWGAIGAVFRSWGNARATTYRRLHQIPDDGGTAVNVQSMVFGNMGDDCATGVAFTRNPSTGEKEVFGEFLINAQGEDVVSGTRTPAPLTRPKEAGATKPGGLASMEEAMPTLYAELLGIFARLEAHYCDMQDVEFTAQKGKLWMLQTRSGKRTTAAGLRIAVEMVEEGMIERDEAVRRIDPASLDQLLHPTIDPGVVREVLTRGLPASPGAATGAVVFEANDAGDRAVKGEAVILVRAETNPEDIHGMHAARGILTSRGGMTSHAAVVARGMGRPCVSGAGELRIDFDGRAFTVGGTRVAEGDVVTIDGSSGEVMRGDVAMIQPELSGDFTALMEWADEIRRLEVRANVETPEDAVTALSFGAQGIGLCRTEHMFFDTERIVVVREMILADNETGRRAALEKLLPMQRSDFIELFKIMAGLPVMIRLLDPPLHEFLPSQEDELSEIAAATGDDVETLRARALKLHEVNPMLGHRGCRLGITFPEIYEMQARAIFEAALEVGKAQGEPVVPEIMIPLIATKAEFDRLRVLIDETADKIAEEKGEAPPYLVGTMIELPRAALCAGQIAESAEFFSFGTNDLTQTTFGISRDDAASFLEIYGRLGVLPQDPFVTLDQEGVGELVRIAAERGRAARPNISLGICGEHGGDPRSIEFCERIGLDYVSCSPYRVPIARLAAARAAMIGEDDG